MTGDDGDPELTTDEKRTLKELAAAATSDGPTRRKVLGAGAGVAAGLIGGGGFLAGQASAQTAAGNIGSQDSLADAYLAHVYDDGGNEVMDFPGDGSVSIDELHTPKLPALSAIDDDPEQTKNALSQSLNSTPSIDPIWIDGAPVEGTTDSYNGSILDSHGRVILIPTNDPDYLGIYEPETDEFTRGPAVNGAWNGGALAPDGRIIMVPTDKDIIGIFDPSDDSYTAGPTIDSSDQYVRAATVPDGRIIFGPASTNYVGIFDPTNDSYTRGPAHGENYGSGAGGSAFLGVTLLTDGRVVFAPSASANVGIFDPTDDSYTSGPAHGEGDVPFSGAVTLPDGRVLFVPTNSDYIGLYDPATDSYERGPAVNADKYDGGTLGFDGRVYLSPRNANRVGIFDYRDDSFTTGPQAHSGGTNEYKDGTLTPSGRIVFGPHFNSNVGVCQTFAQADQAWKVALHPIVNNA